MRDSSVITIPSDPKYLCVVRTVSAKMGELYGLNNEETEDVIHAVDEACSNAIKYACRGDTSQKIVVKFKLTMRGFEVIIEDTGIKTDPDAIKGRDLDDVRPGGLGVHFIKKAFDIFYFDEKKKTGNRLMLTKLRKDKK